MVYDPVEMVFDENGRIFVAEMVDYPEDPPPGKPARSRIIMLEDTDGDGKIDRRTVFADDVLCYRLNAVERSHIRSRHSVFEGQQRQRADRQYFPYAFFHVASEGHCQHG
jgi:hypothetical protein